ncbi:hypothetical protein N0V84_003882 [Fusarium piperis]|uniref:Uncharacterized protein n=1 Tax=Fusarium piperis TaxID=1435070 RepID=A0A9W9BQR3_9HYPO|nr:hypothetical protein N0V84_003882 [Fusarium piperis]
MSNRKRPISVSEELRDQLEGHLDDLVKAGEVALPPGKRIRLNPDGIPKVVEIPAPAISEKRIHQLYRHIACDSSTPSSEWGVMHNLLEDLMSDEELRAACTHIKILYCIEAVQKLVVEDFQSLIDLAQVLNASPASIKNTNFAVDLPRLVGRILGEGPKRSVVQNEDKILEMLAGLEKSHCGVYVLINQIRRYHHCASVNHGQQYDLGQRAAHCLQALVAIMRPYDPRKKMDHKVFRSLRERVDGIRRGNREASTDIENKVDYEVEDETEDETEDGTEV